MRGRIAVQDIVPHKVSGGILREPVFEEMATLIRRAAQWLKENAHHQLINIECLNVPYKYRKNSFMVINNLNWEQLYVLRMFYFMHITSVSPSGSALSSASTSPSGRPKSAPNNAPIRLTSSSNSPNGSGSGDGSGHPLSHKEQRHLDRTKSAGARPTTLPVPPDPSPRSSSSSSPSPTPSSEMGPAPEPINLDAMTFYPHTREDTKIDLR